LTDKYPWIEWGLEPFINFIQKGKFSSASSNRLMEMYILPNSHTLLFGDGWYSNPSGRGYYMSTDVGFLRPVFFWGIFPTMLYYFTVLLLLFLINIKLKKKEGAFFSTMLFLQLVLFEFKGEIMLPLFSILFPVCLQIGLSSRKSRINNQQIVVQHG
jgi:hypothetical protein